MQEIKNRENDYEDEKKAKYIKKQKVKNVKRRLAK
jgi:hypothetical protein